MAMADDNADLDREIEDQERAATLAAMADAALAHLDVERWEAEEAAWHDLAQQFRALGQDD
jgi:hypothetical protein